MNTMMDDGFFHIVCCSQDPDGGVALVRLGSGGRPELCGFTELAGANYLIPGKNGCFYASGSDAEFHGYVAALRAGGDGALTVAGRVGTGGLGCCHLCLSPDGGTRRITGAGASPASPFRRGAGSAAGANSTGIWGTA